MLIADDSSILAYIFVLCSITAFLPRFGGYYETKQELNADKKDVRRHIMQAGVDGHEHLATRRETRQPVILAIAI